MLPEGVIRHDKKSYEEVNIPVAEPAPVNVGNERVAISSLDDVSQIYTKKKGFFLPSNQRALLVFYFFF